MRYRRFFNTRRLCAFASLCLCVLFLFSAANSAQTGPGEDPSGVSDVVDLATRAFEEAEQLRAEGTRPALLKAVKKYEESRRNWRLLKRGYSEAVTANALGLTLYALGETRRAVACFTQALPGLRAASGKKLLVASTLNNLGVARADLDEERAAISCFEQALAIYRAESERAGEARTLNNIGKSHRDLGDLETAKKYYEQALVIYGEVYEARDEAIALNNLGVVLWQQNQHRAALEKYERSLLLRRIAGDRSGAITTLGNMALAYDALNETENAKKCREEAERMKKDPENE